jgi:hypothetical protein
MVAMDWPKLPLSGRCPCDAVGFEITAMPYFVYACHCTECQRWSGSAFSMSMPVAASSFHMRRGAPRPWCRAGASGIRSTYWFCGDCGGRVFGEREGRPDVVVVRAGTLDQTWWLRPIAHVFLRSAQAWQRIPNHMECFDEVPKDFSSLGQRWRALYQPQQETRAAD